MTISFDGAGLPDGRQRKTSLRASFQNNLIFNPLNCVLDSKFRHFETAGETIPISNAHQATGFLSPKSFS